MGFGAKLSIVDAKSNGKFIVVAFRVGRQKSFPLWEN